MSGSEVKALNQPTSSQLEIKFDSDLGVFWAYNDACTRGLVFNLTFTTMS